MEIETKTYNSLELTLSLSIYSKAAAKKHWSLSKIVFLDVEQPFAACNVCPVSIQEIFGQTQGPITGNSFIESLF